MSLTEIVWGVVGATLMFWAVGAYNRLVRLRAAIVRRFAPVHEQFTHRHTLLLRQRVALEAALPNAGPRLEALRVACQQADAACAQARLRPGATRTIAHLRLAEHGLVEARARLPVQSIAGVDLAALNAELGASDATLAFARQQFNAAVDDYNRAVRQFPTVLIVGLFGFRAAATL